MAETRSAYADHPGYRVDLLPQSVRVRVWQGETLLADGRRTLLVKETAHREVIYFPEDDVRLDLFDASDHHSFCPSFSLEGMLRGIDEVAKGDRAAHGALSCRGAEERRGAVYRVRRSTSRILR